MHSEPHFLKSQELFTIPTLSPRSSSGSRLFTASSPSFERQFRNRRPLLKLFLFFPQLKVKQNYAKPRWQPPASVWLFRFVWVVSRMLIFIHFIVSFHLMLCQYQNPQDKTLASYLCLPAINMTDFNSKCQIVAVQLAVDSCHHMWHCPVGKQAIAAIKIQTYAQWTFHQRLVHIKTNITVLTWVLATKINQL